MGVLERIRSKFGLRDAMRDTHFDPQKSLDLEEHLLVNAVSQGLRDKKLKRDDPNISVVVGLFPVVASCAVPPHFEHLTPNERHSVREYLTQQGVVFNAKK